MANASKGHFVWHEHLTTSPNAAIAFYTEVIGWRTQPFGEGDYTMWVGSQGPLGGVMRLPEDSARMGAAPHWMGNVQVENVDDVTSLASRLGGKVYKEPADIPTVGRFAVIADPQGAAISIFKPNAPMILHDAAKEGAFCWAELHTTDSAAAFEFYSEVFGWKILREMELGGMGAYRVFGVADQQLGGMVTTPKGSAMPVVWLYYVQTSDLDAATLRATRRGAKVVSGPVDVPGGARVVQFLDPQGAGFALHQLPRT